MRHHAKLLSASLVLLAAVAGCDQPELTPGSVIDRDRVLGARVEVEGDASRAWPMPGENVTVRWIVAAPDAPDRQPWTLAVCAGDASGCASDPFLADGGLDVEPTLTIAVPSADSLGDGDSDRLWIVGEIGESKVVATVLVAVDGVELANRNPSIGDDATTIAGAPWLAPGGSAPSDCAAAAGGASLPSIRATDGEIALALTLDAADREPYAVALPDGSTRNRLETLQVSHFTTAGTLDRQFSVIEGDDDAATVIEVGWTPPEDLDEVPDAGQLVRVTFVVRDGRGGLDVASRQICVVP